MSIGADLHSELVLFVRRDLLLVKRRLHSGWWRVLLRWLWKRRLWLLCKFPINATDLWPIDTANAIAHTRPEHATIIHADWNTFRCSDRGPIRTPDSRAIATSDGYAELRSDADADHTTIVLTNECARALTDASTIVSTVCERADVCDLGMRCVQRHLLFIRRELSGGGRGLSRGRLRERLMRLL